MMNTRNLQKKLDALEKRRYKVEFSIGKGQFGEVYGVKDRLRGLIAVKEPIDQEDREGMSDLFNEMYNANIKSPYVIKIYDAPKLGETRLLLMELMDADLETTLSQEGGIFKETKALDITIKLCKGLEAIHAKGYCHRDIQKRNILFDKNGNPKIADLGLIKRSNLSTSTPKGAPQYTAPEQQIEDENGRFNCYIESDIYSMGALLYEMIAGKMVFEQFKTVKSINKHKVDKKFIENHGNKYISNKVMKVIRKCLQPIHTDRYKSAKQLYTALKNI